MGVVTSGAKTTAAVTSEATGAEIAGRMSSGVIVATTTVAVTSVDKISLSYSTPRGNQIFGNFHNLVYSPIAAPSSSMFTSGSFNSPSILHPTASSGCSFFGVYNVGTPTSSVLHHSPIAIPATTPSISAPPHAQSSFSPPTIGRRHSMHFQPGIRMPTDPEINY